MPFTVQVVIDQATLRLATMPEAIRAALRGVILKDGPELARRVRAKLSGQVLHVRSGRLLNSIYARMVENPRELTGQVGSQGVPYARIHELGGRTRPHMIYPRNALALRFMIGERVIFAKSVNHPGSLIPKRSYLASSLEEMRDQLMTDMINAVRQGAQRDAA